VARLVTAELKVIVASVIPDANYIAAFAADGQQVHDA
jgi:hypothetical protein